MSLTLLLTIVLIALCCGSVNGEVLLVYSIQRHGARNALAKTDLLQEAESIGGVTLLPQGQRMCYDAGAAFRSRYINRTTCGATCLPIRAGADAEYGLRNYGRGFHNYNTYVRSSTTDRAMLSAQAFFAGIFPANVSGVNDTWGIPTGQDPMPVYLTPDVDDTLIRTYTKCRTYDQRLLAWYNGTDFQNKAAQTLPLRQHIAQAGPANLNVDLTNWWNVYDTWNVWRTYGVGDPMPPLPDTDFKEVAALATWLEISKMSSDLTGNLLGGPLLGDMLRYMQDAITTASQRSGGWYRLLSISSHYNVQLGLLSALLLDKYPPAAQAVPWFTTKLPALASVAVFELHGTRDPTSLTIVPGSTQAVRLVAQDGPNASYVVVPMPCAVAGDAAEALAGPGACTLENFRNLAVPAAMATPGQWCDACNNTVAAQCALSAAAGNQLSLQSTLSSTQSDLQSAHDEKDQLRVGLIVGLIVAVALGVLTNVATFMYMRSRAHSRYGTHAAVPLSSTLSTSGSLTKPLEVTPYAPHAQV